ncbi:MAG: hypothetical protein L0154_12305, partial [Chloroflexi bacterium]|nr:hypothetical protein [Chloroflexota bacterium]
MKRLVLTCFALLLTVAVMAQETCPDLVQSALESLDRVCQITGRNEICYGNTRVALTGYSDEILTFDAPGDVEALAHVESVEVSAMLEPDVWGIAVMKVQANLPGTLPGQNVTFLL